MQRKLFSFFQHLIYLKVRFFHKFQQVGSADFDQFLNKAKSDEILVPNLPEWNDECTLIARELFENLDRNKDARLNRKDLEEIEKIDVNFWAGK